MLLAEVLKKNSGKTNKGIAEETGLNVTTVSMLMLGHLRPYRQEWQEKIAAALGYDGELAKLFEEVEVL